MLGGTRGGGVKVTQWKLTGGYTRFPSEPKPVYAQPGQPDVDLPVSPSDAPVPSAAHDDSILRYGNPIVTPVELLVLLVEFHLSCPLTWLESQEESHLAGFGKSGRQ